MTRTTPPRDGTHDFDFLHGTWRRHDRRLHRTPSGSKEWQEFSGVSVVRPLGDGQGNLEEYQADSPDGPLHAVSLHLYNPRSGQWSLSWADRRQGILGPPATGEFRDGRGEFFSFEEDEGRMAYLRLTWNRVGPGEVGFEQARSRDGGRSWEADWVMRFTRVPAGDPQPSAVPWPAPLALQDGSGEGAHGFDFLHGRWRVRSRRLRHPLTGSREWYEFEGTSIERPFWDGQGNLEEYEGDSPEGRIRGLALRLFEPRSKQWSIHWSSSALGTRDRAMVGEFENGRGEFYNQDLFDGREVLVRFLWTSAGANAARWEQAFSVDGGRTWEPNWIMGFTRATCCPVVELRQYTLHPGQRDSPIALFDREFVETQEATGMQVIAQFRDLDRPDVFTWLRGFPDMTSANTFPRLPVREGEHAFVWLARFADAPSHASWKARLESSRAWRERVGPLLDRYLQSPPEIWRLTPTARSRSLG